MAVGNGGVRYGAVLASFLTFFPAAAFAEILLTVAPTFDPLVVSPINISGAAPNEKLTIITTRTISVWR